MKYKFRDLVDLNSLQNLMDELYKLTGITNAILDSDKRFIITTGWQDICSKYHRATPATAHRCAESDNYIDTRIDDGYVIYECQNGLMDAATPIIVNGEHLATIYVGQWLEKEPDIAFFEDQARIFGFSTKEYLEALSKVPIITRSKIETNMRFVVQLAEMLSNLGLKQLEQKETEESLRSINCNLESLVAERTAKLNEANANLRRDLAKRKELEKEIIRLDRLNLVGEMAASLAHEMRNPMTTIRGFLQFFKYNPDFSEHQDNLDLMIEEIDRANSIITEYLSLAKDKVLNLSRLNLNTILDSIMPLLSFYAIKREIDVVMELEEVADCLLDDKEIRQLVLNLVRNSIEAINLDGRVVIRTFMQEGKVVMAIIDEGPGIPAEILDKLGTPFFTTKEEGTGLGLAVCYNIAARHNATIDFTTSSEGTTFFVRFDPA
ncbi:MAG: PocR ligand-binding domain-containing protein [Syntrophomonadaceae bacterium]|jgi:signal transduction histidine kinase